MIQRLLKSWATLSLAAGAFSTGIDLAIGATLLSVGASTRAAAMTGTLVGSTITFFLNRAIAFRESKPRLVVPLLRFILFTLVASTIHGQVVVHLRDQWGISYAPAKILADLCVFTFAQLIVFRYFVFPKPKDPPATASPSA